MIRTTAFRVFSLVISTGVPPVFGNYHLFSSPEWDNGSTPGNRFHAQAPNLLPGFSGS